MTTAKSLSRFGQRTDDFLEKAAAGACKEDTQTYNDGISKLIAYSMEGQHAEDIKKFDAEDAFAALGNLLPDVKTAHSELTFLADLVVENRTTVDAENLVAGLDRLIANLTTIKQNVQGLREKAR